MYAVKRLLTAVACLGLAAGISQNAHAAVLLSDSFDADSLSTQLNFNGFINWTVDMGTVDYIRSGTAGITCVGAAGGCVDSDGSTNDAGRLLSKGIFSVPFGTSFTLSLDVSGNQRNVNPDSLLLGVAFEPNPTFISASFTCTRAGNAPFSPCSFTTPFGSGVPFRVFIQGVGGDNIGAVFDNLLLTSNIAQASEPITLALIGIAVAGLGFSRRRTRG